MNILSTINNFLKNSLLEKYNSIKSFVIRNKLISIKYSNQINNYLEKNGPEKTFSKIIIDFKKFSTDLDSNNPENNIHYYTLLSNIIIHQNTVTKEIHFFRNNLNITPSTLDEMININKQLPKEKQWKLLPSTKSAFHMHGENGVFNLKFVSSSGHFEAVYNNNGDLLTYDNDPINMGTYNYFGPENAEMHLKYDVKPYYEWGNSSSIEDVNGELEELARAAANIAKFKLSSEAKKRYESIYNQIYS